MGLAKRLAEVQDDMKMVVRLLSPSGTIESIVLAKKEVEILHLYDGRDTFYVPRIAALEAYDGYKVIDARVKR